MSSKDKTPIDQESMQHTEPMATDTSRCDQPISLPTTTEAAIALGLKRLYSEMLAEPMPDKFAGLLDQLSKADRKPEQPS